MEMNRERRNLLLEVQTLISEGVKQKDIAYELDISPAYVSILKKQLIEMNMTKETLEDIVMIPVFVTRSQFESITEWGTPSDVMLYATLEKINMWAEPKALHQVPQVNIPAPKFDISPDALEDLDEDIEIERPIFTEPEYEDTNFGKPNSCPECDDSFGIIHNGSAVKGTWYCTECGSKGTYSPDTEPKVD